MRDITAPGPCVVAREAIHARLDGDALHAGALRSLERHLAECAACRQVETELARLQTQLRAVPLPPFPDGDLQEVWARTSRAPRSFAHAARRASAVAAALLLAVLLGSWIERLRTPDPQEIARAAAETRYVLALAGRALDRTERETLGRVLTREVSPALRRVPMKLPGAGAPHKGGAS